MPLQTIVNSLALHAWSTSVVAEVYSIPFGAHVPVRRTGSHDRDRHRAAQNLS